MAWGLQDVIKNPKVAMAKIKFFVFIVFGFLINYEANL